MEQKKYPVIIVGSGISGLYSALKISQILKQNQELKNEHILLITKQKLGESNSYYAQGGMVAVLKSNKNDSVKSHVDDTLVAGAGLCDINTVSYISENSDKVVADLLNFGVEFDKDENGNFTLTKEAAHSVNRILHSAGDATGREIEKALIKAIKKCDNVEILEYTAVVDLLTDNNECDGVIIYKNGVYTAVYSDVVILATGGLGQIYKYTTNPSCATGDGLALAYRAGAKLRDIEFVQFHPTALAFDDPKNNNRFLISEAVRGEGAKLCDKNGFEYMINYDIRKELAPRDIVARANILQMEKDNENCVYLNATIIEKEKLLKRFPTIAKKCFEYGIDITKDYIPVAPAAHYFMGGILTNLNSETTIKNLYAIGEVASTGLHGANRLASNSLLECVVSAYSVSENLVNKLKNKYVKINKTYEKLLKYNNTENQQSINILLLEQYIKELKNTMWENVGIFRTEKSLKSAIEKIKNLKKEFNKKDVCSSIEEYNLRNMLIISEIISTAALDRKESRGAHYRTDYLFTEKTAKHSII